MAYLLSSERPAVAAVSYNPFAALARWYVKVRAANAQKLVLANLLALDEHRLDDLGIDRQDLFDALHTATPRRPPAASRGAVPLPRATGSIPDPAIAGGLPFPVRYQCRVPPGPAFFVVGRSGGGERSRIGAGTLMAAA